LNTLYLLLVIPHLPPKVLLELVAGQPLFLVVLAKGLSL
jgi:hypothetical protein